MFKPQVNSCTQGGQQYKGGLLRLSLFSSFIFLTLAFQYYRL